MEMAMRLRWKIEALCCITMPCRRQKRRSSKEVRDVPAAHKAVAILSADVARGDERRGALVLGAAHTQRALGDRSLSRSAGWAGPGGTSVDLSRRPHAGLCHRLSRRRRGLLGPRA